MSNIEENSPLLQRVVLPNMPVGPWRKTIQAIRRQTLWGPCSDHKHSRHTIRHLCSDDTTRGDDTTCCDCVSQRVPGDFLLLASLGSAVSRKGSSKLGSLITFLLCSLFISSSAARPHTVSQEFWSVYQDFEAPWKELIWNRTWKPSK